MIKGKGRRQLQSWIESFVRYTDNLGSPEIWCRWVAIGTLAAVMEEKIGMKGTIFPNLYTFLVGPPGLGKSRAIMKGRELFSMIPDTYIAPNSMTAASLLDALVECPRFKQRLATRQDPLEYHTMTLFADDWQVLMTKYEEDTIAQFTQFYDSYPFRHTRRTSKIDIKMASPQLNIIAGTTPSDLLNPKRFPPSSWGAGFTSRSIFVYSNQCIIFNRLAAEERKPPPELVSDLQRISDVIGQFDWVDEYEELMTKWQKGKEEPKPTHPKLKNYNSRRYMHLLKLSMVHSISRGNDLILKPEDFNAAYGWLREAEVNMPEMFHEGTKTVDAEAMDEIVEQVRQTNGTGMTQATMLRVVSNHVVLNKVKDVIEMLVAMERIEKRDDKYYVL